MKQIMLFSWTIFHFNMVLFPDKPNEMFINIIFFSLLGVWVTLSDDVVHRKYHMLANKF